MNSNVSRMNQGLDIYLDAMRRYIAKQMQLKVPGDWFRDRVMGVLYKWQDEIEEDLEKGKSKEEVLEFKHFPAVICHRDNKSVFSPGLAGGKRRNSIAELWMQEITMWRNNVAHRPMDDFSDQDADRTLDTCARVLHLVDSVAAKKVTDLFHDPQDLKRKLKDERANHKETQRGASKAEDLKKQLKKEKDDHRNTHQRLKETKKQKSIAEEGKQKAEGTLQRLKDEHNTTKQKLKAEQDEHNTTKQKLKSTEESKGPAEQSHKPSDPQVQAKLDAYREKFDAAKSGNGRKRPFRVEEDKDWFVTLWVGEVRGKPRACVFAPWKSSDSGWIKAGEEPLIDQPCNGEGEAFEYLRDVEKNGEIERLAHQAIADYNAPEPPQYDEVPF